MITSARSRGFRRLCNGGIVPAGLLSSVDGKHSNLRKQRNVYGTRKTRECIGLLSFLVLSIALVPQACNVLTSPNVHFAGKTAGIAAIKKFRISLSRRMSCVLYALDTCTAGARGSRATGRCDLLLGSAKTGPNGESWRSVACGSRAPVVQVSSALNRNVPSESAVNYTYIPTTFAGGVEGWKEFGNLFLL